MSSGSHLKEFCESIIRCVKRLNTLINNGVAWLAGIHIYLRKNVKNIEERVGSLDGLRYPQH